MSLPKKLSSRIIALDLLRGYFLVAILFDHLFYFPNGIDWMSGRGQLYVTAAEGFFFISGIVLGIVRGRKLLDKPFALTAKLLLKRGVQLYITAIVLFFVFTFIGWLFIDNPGIKPGIRPMSENFWTIIVNALNFNYIYGWADYLRLYAVYLLVSPLAMYLLRKGKWYILLVVSLVIWWMFDFSTLETTELSQVFSWQLIFFGGMSIGFYMDPIRHWWMRQTDIFKRSVIATTVAITLTTMVANFILVVWGKAILGPDMYFSVISALDPLLNKERLPLYRIVLFLLWFGASFWFVQKIEPFILRWFSWILIPFGTNSLYVYTIEAFIIYFAHLLIAQPSTNWLLNLAMCLICLGLTWLAVRFKFLMKIIPR